jgi:ribosomal protein S12 methylthiotransferase
MRTTFIVGFPGETEEDVQDLEDFIREGHFSSVGIFTYSPEQGTPSFDLPGHIDEKEKKARRDRLMRAQQEVVGERLAGFLGKTIDVLVEGVHEDTDLLLTGRARFQAPEVDGTVIINDLAEGLEGVAPGEIRQVEITEIAGYDLVGKVIA